MASVVWNGEQIAAEMRDKMNARVQMAGFYFRNVLRQELSTPGPEPSAPGEFPHKQRGHLRRNVNAEFNPAISTSRVGTNVPYGKWLELGTTHMMPRPWLSQGMTFYGGDVRLILSGEFKGNAANSD